MKRHTLPPFSAFHFTVCEATGKRAYSHDTARRIVFVHKRLGWASRPHHFYRCGSCARWHLSTLPSSPEPVRRDRTAPKDWRLNLGAE